MRYSAHRKTFFSLPIVLGLRMTPISSAFSNFKFYSGYWILHALSSTSKNKVTFIFSGL